MAGSITGGTAAFPTNIETTNNFALNDSGPGPKINTMEDYQQSLGEMQMIQNMRISENGSGLHLRGSMNKFNRSSMNMSQNEAKKA